MKQLALILSILSILVLTSCGGENPVENPEENTEEVQLKGFEELDLTEYGFNLSVMVPEAETNGEAQVNLTERGALEIVVGDGFGLEIMFGEEGALELLKTDLAEDLVFKSEIIKEEENALIYTQDIPDSGVKTQNHFFYKAAVGADIYEVRDIMEGEYGASMIEKMLKAARTIKSTSAVEVAA